MTETGHYVYHSEIRDGASFYTHREPCTCGIRRNHWSDENAEEG